jgi:hypothetical protein
MRATWCETPELVLALHRGQSELEAVSESLHFENSVLDLWFEGSHDPQHGADAKSKGPVDRDQVMAVVQALRQQSEATGTSPTPAEPVSEVARAFLLSGPKQSALIPPSPTPNAGIPPSAIQSARTLLDSAQDTVIPASTAQNSRINDPGRLAAGDSLIKSRYASTILKVARRSDRETAARLVRGISRDFPLRGEIPEIANLHHRAIASFDRLATSLVDAIDPIKQQPLWKAALDAAAEWLRAVQPNGDNSAASHDPAAAK